jgi:hypothetical protein
MELPSGCAPLLGLILVVVAALAAGILALA